MNKTPLRCSFRSSGYSEAEIEQLKDDLSEFVVLQPRRQGIPEAGGSFDISFVLQFVGELVVAGAVWDLIKFTGTKLLEFYQCKKNDTGGYPPEIDILELRFDNVDLRLRGRDLSDGEECNFLSDVTLEHLASIVEVIAGHLGSEPLNLAGIQVVDVYEPKVEMIDGNLNLLFDIPWKLTGIDVMSPQTYDPSSMTLDDVTLDIQ